mgnify:CR=1 FL=1
MLTDAMIQAIQSGDLFPLATASWEGVPNVVPVKYLGVMDRHRLWITDNYLSKTCQNLEENPWVAVYVISQDPKACWQIKGSVTSHREGEMYQTMRERVLKINADLPARALLLLDVEAIYDCMPGEGAGQLIWQSSSFGPQSCVSDGR